MTITQQLNSGSSSSAKLIGGCVIRTPNANQNTEEWLKTAKTECLITKELQQTACTVPQAILVDNTLISPFFDGTPMDEQTYLELLPEKQKTVSEAFADFLWQLHHLKKVSFTDERYTTYKLNKKVKNVVLPDDVQNILEAAVGIVTKDNRVQVQTGICHNDLIKNNILFNEKQNKLGIIDFGDAALGSVYRDFGSLCRPGQLGIKFMADVVMRYNEISKQQHEPEIDFCLVKQVALLQTFEKLHYYKGDELESRLDELREFNQKLFSKKINTPMISAFMYKGSEK